MAPRVEIKTVRKTLADGTIREYHYDKATGAAIKGKVGTTAFAAELQKVRATRGPMKWAVGTIGHLLTSYQTSREWAELSPATREIYSRVLSELSGTEHVPVSELKVKHVKAIRDRLAERSPARANQFRCALGAAVTWGTRKSGIEEYEELHNVAYRVDRVKLGSTWRAWRPAEQEAFRAAENPVSVRLAFHLLLYTGQRRGDVLKMRWLDFDPQGFGGMGALRVVAQKTAHGDEDALHLPCHPALRVVLDEARGGTSDTFLVTRQDGQPYWSPNYATAQDRARHFAEVMRRAQWKVFGEGNHVPLHGLRKSASIILAELGLSPHQIQAITGHNTLQMVELYTRGANQKRMAETAMRAWAADSKPTVEGMIPVATETMPVSGHSGN